ncbi:uncharacterized protein SPSK_03626 [Sporothrix schenckii 1099-18]|uniref:Infection structure specific protein n=2 Tax=Sporothrix schenckii TaxID=29908 RepID=U7PPE2_SPOS1|nr:uncharacterized protein SPSK_03626 [Sporothrix schenckii 1099-18]ERS97437.1 hypothetical protein HMPREF1624_05604 [Sporothrix schenckii ATCC 58251]KJR81935.1 hypothetical protein SPSK_03626 [Sporothrix schenckii 1099-18]
MYTKSILLAALAASASATRLFPGQAALKRGLDTRQTGSAGGDETCATELSSAYDTIPTPPPVIQQWEMTAVISDPCNYTPPPSVEAAFSTYSADLEDWYSSHSKEIASILSTCEAYAPSGEESTSVAGLSDYCATAGGSGGGSGGGSSGAATTTAKHTKGSGATESTAEPTKTSGGSGTTAGSGSGSGTTTTSAGSASKTNAGSKDTAAVGVAALAMAGALCVAAAL